MTAKLPPIYEAFDEKLISVTEFQRMGYDFSNLTTEDVINVVMDIAQSDGYKLEGKGRVTGDNTFHICSTEVFEWSVDEDDDGPAILLEIIEMPVMIGTYTLEEIAELDNIEGPNIIQDRVTEILSGLAEVSVERADSYFKALGKAYSENQEEDFCGSKDDVLEDDEMRQIDDDLYGEVYDRLQIPKENPNEKLIAYLTEAWDEGLEEIVRTQWLPED